VENAPDMLRVLETLSEIVEMSHPTPEAFGGSDWKEVEQAKEILAKVTGRKYTDA
jgi:hypothetical protein